MALSTDQIRSFASGAGFSGSDLDIAVAVAMAESSGNPNAHNSTPPDDSYGLMQINMIGSLGPDRRKRFGISSNTQLYDPATNMRAAKIIKDGSGWKAWTTYTSGKYKDFLPGGKSFLDGIKGGLLGAGPQLAGDAAGQFGGISNALNAIGANFVKVGNNIAGIIIAVVLLVIGVIILAHKPIGTAVKTVSKVTP